MTSPNTGLRRTALVVLAVGAALGASACSAGQLTQTSNQVAAVDGGQGSVGDLTVNDLVVSLPAAGDAEARVGFTASYTGYGFGEPVTVDRVQIAGTPVQLGEAPALERGCSIVFTVRGEADPNPGGEGVCVTEATATIPAGELSPGTSVPATVSFSNGDQLETDAAIVTETPEAGVYTRPAEYAGHSEGH